MMRRLIIRTLMALVAAFSLGLAHAAGPMDEYQLKAAFIYRFAQFTTWPPPPLRHFTLCMAGSRDGLQDALLKLAAKPWADVTMQVVVIDQPEQAKGCQLLVLGQADRQELRRWLAVLDTSPVLMVADTPEGFRAGADIGLIQDPNGLAFRINLSDSKRRGLTLSSQMLKLAREIH